MENNTHPVQKITTPMAIIIAGFLIMIGMILSRSGTDTKQTKTLSEQVGVSKEQLAACVKETNLEDLYTSITTSVTNAMSGVKEEERGTPYSIVIGPNGFKTDIKGALSYEVMSQVIAAAKDGVLAKDSTGKNITEIYTGNLDITEPTDHLKGNKDAPVTIIEYSDFECPYCKQFQPVVEKLVAESNGSVSWIYRNYPLHQHSFEKLVAAECVAKIKGNDAYWKYGDLLFGLLDVQNSVSEKL